MAHAFFRSRGLWAGSPAVKTQLLQEIKTKDLGEKKNSTNKRQELRLGMKLAILIAEVCKVKVRFRHSPLKLLPHASVICWTFNHAQALVINDMVLSMTLRLYFKSSYCSSSIFNILTVWRISGGGHVLTTRRAVVVSIIICCLLLLLSSLLMLFGRYRCHNPAV